MQSWTSEDLKCISEKVAEGESFSKKAIISSRKYQSKNGFRGDFYKVKIRECHRTLSLMVKSPIDKQDEDHITKLAFTNEIRFYDEIQTEFKQLLQEYSANLEQNIFVKHYKFDRENNESYLILEDLEVSGYEVLDKEEELDDENCRLIIKSLGEFHALSFALKYIKPKTYHELSVKLNDLFLEYIKSGVGFIKECFDSIEETVREVENFDEYEHFLKNAEATYEKILEASMQENFSCIIHRDTWLNNFMFKYKILDGRHILEDIKLLDWQTCFYGSPVLDLSYFVYASASKNVLDGLSSVLVIYHKALTNILNQFNLNVEEIYPFEVLKKHWVTYGQFGVIRGLMTTKIKLTDLRLFGEECSFGDIMRSECDPEKMSGRALHVLQNFNEFKKGHILINIS